MPFELIYGASPEWQRQAKEPDEVGSASVLLIDPTADSPREQRQRLDRWCAALPAMSELEAVYLAGQVPQRLFDAACEAPALQVLQLKVSSIRSLEALRPEGPLRQLDLGASARIESIDALSSMRGLDQLRVENLKLISNLEPLRELTSLVGLAYSGGWGSSHPRIDSLSPLGGLVSLEWLDIAALRVDDRSLRPLVHLSNLKRLQVPLWYPTDEYAYLSAHLPHVLSDTVPTFRANFNGPCPRCGHPEMVQPIGHGKRKLCPACQTDKIADFVTRFEADVARYAAGAL